MKNIVRSFCFVVLIAGMACNTASKKKEGVAVIGFVDAFVDETIEKAKTGYYDALEQNGLSEKNNNLKIIYRNAQGDIPALTQICDYYISEVVDVIATNATLSTITAVQKTKEIPVCMMVSPSPANANLLDANKQVPANLFGVYETLDYIDTSVTLVRTFFEDAKQLGVIYNQAEPQSVNALAQIKNQCKLLGLEVKEVSVSNSSETQLAVQSLINRGIDCFFAMPDNTVFASFEVIAQLCNNKNIPIFTSEAGLVKRGALCAYGADMYQWGYQAGLQTALYLKSGKKQLPKPELVKLRNRIINSAVAKKFNLDSNTKGFVSL